VASTTTPAHGLPSPRCPPLPILKHEKPRTRRGRRKSRKLCTNNPSSIKSDGNWTILHSNIRGFNSKKISLENIIIAVSPSVITLNEVGLRGGKKCSIKGYDTYTRNRKNQSMGGIATSIRKDESEFCLKVEEGEDNDEFMITRHG
jgi:hypothetical protein